MSLLGMTVVDRITGFKGVVTGYVRYLTGCNQALVCPPVGDDGALRDSTWFDEQRLIVREDMAPVLLDNRAATASTVPRRSAERQTGGFTNVQRPAVSGFPTRASWGCHP